MKIRAGTSLIHDLRYNIRKLLKPQDMVIFKIDAKDVICSKMSSENQISAGVLMHGEHSRFHDQ